MKKKNYLRGNFNKLTSFFKPLPLTALFIIVFITNGYSLNNSVNEDVEINLQELTVTGTVSSDDLGGAIPGVSVVLKGTSIGAVTDFDGNYKIKVPSSNSVLVFSYIGFNTVEKTVGNNKSINVTLTSSVSELDEIIVVGYGVAKKETLTGAVEQVKAKAFQDLAVTNPGLALQGRTPGLTVTRSSTRPGGEGLNFLIRGQTSVNGIAPLLVIDGVPALNNSSFSDMNPDDIENVSILKGASASVYGARGAGGVIIVTTKKGKGEVKVEVSTVLRYSTIGIRPPTPTMEEYANVYLDAASNDKNPYYFFWDKESLESMAAGEERIYENGILGNIYLGNGNIFDQMYGDTFSNQHNVSISGSSEKSDFRLSGGYDHNVGALKTAYDGAKKYNFAFNYNYNISDRLKMGVNVTYFHKHFSGPSTGFDASSISYDAPLFLAQNPYGQWMANFGKIGGGNNAIAATVDGGRTNNKTEQFRFILSADYKITDDLSFATTYSVARDFKNYQKYVLNVPTYGWFGEKANSSINTTPYIFEEKDEGTYKNIKGALNYKKSLGDHNLTATLAVEAELKTSKNLEARRDGFEDFGVYDLNLAPIDVNVTTKGGAGT
jgi:TonB-linked SusC/RagA family outer membrane protein